MAEALEANGGSVAARREHVWTECIRRAGSGDGQALGQLYDETSALVYSVALRMLGDAADAEEITLDVYTYVWRNGSRYDARRGNATAWLVMLTRSRAIDRIRSRAASRDAEVPVENLDAAGPWTAGAEADARFMPEREAVRRALRELPAEQRQLLELAFFSGYSQSELAAKLNLPLGTVKTRIRLAMTRLRDLLKELVA